MDITTLILLIVSVVNLIILFIVFSKTNQKNTDLPELKNRIAVLQDQTTQTFANMNERMIRIETNVDRVTKDIGTNFRENRKEISDNFGLVQKTLDTRVRELQDHNTKKLEEMRQTVDEKLQASVEKRFNESFKTISTQLTQVYQGLGEMKTLANGVGDLKKVMEGVKTRGIYGEVQLGNIISDTLSSDQYCENIATKKGSSDRVEFAVKMPGKDESAQVFLPIDSKFPVENYQRLITAYEQGDKTEILKFQKALALDVKEQAKKISTKYIDPPHTTEFAMMFLPTESLYAEILRIHGLDDEIRQKFHITIASPSTLPVILSGLLMGFRTLAIEKRSSEVWQILGAVKSQFGKFGDLLEATKKKLQESANKIDAAATTSRAIERKLKNVESLPSSESLKLLDGLDDQDFNSEENS